MATRKIKGGDVNLNRVFRRILSVGFEYETGLLTKLTLVEDTDEDGNPVNILLNTDTARDNIRDLEDTNLDETNPYYEDYLLRQNETMELPILDNQGKPDKNSKFYVTNDIASSPFLHLWTFKTPIYPTGGIKKSKNVKSIMMVLLFPLLFW